MKHSLFRDRGQKPLHKNQLGCARTRHQGSKSNTWVVWASCIAAVVLFLVASFLAWNEEHGERVSAEKKLTDRNPKLSLNIESTIWVFDKELQRMIFVLSAYLLNTGEPSVAMSWRAKYQMGDDVEDMTGFYLRDDGYKITIGDEILTLTNDNLLMPQVLTRRLERGEGKLGRIIFSVPRDRSEQIATHQFVITVTCHDFQGTPCFTAYKPSGVPLPSVMMFPGEKLRKTEPKEKPPEDN
jgi:hypothetical protein